MPMPHTGLKDEKIIAKRILIAEAEKHKTHGEILRDGLFGPKDKSRSKSGTNKLAEPRLKIDNPRNQGQEIQGRPRTGKLGL